MQADVSGMTLAGYYDMMRYDEWLRTMTTTKAKCNNKRVDGFHVNKSAEMHSASFPPPAC